MRIACARTWIVFFLFLSASPQISILHADEQRPGLSPAPFFYGMRVGVLAHDVNHLWSRSRAESGLDWNVELVFSRPGWFAGPGRVLSNIGASINNRSGTSKLYGGLVWEALFGGVFFFNTGAGLALHDGDLDHDESNGKQLGSRLLFRVPLEVGVSWGGRHRLSLMFDHVSNAYLANPNEGLDTLGLRYGFQF